jgi:hypothetical protein
MPGNPGAYSVFADGDSRAATGTRALDKLIDLTMCDFSHNIGWNEPNVGDNPESVSILTAIDCLCLLCYTPFPTRVPEDAGRKRGGPPGGFFRTSCIR